MSEKIPSYFDYINKSIIEERLRSYGFDIAKGHHEILPGDKNIGNIILIKQIHNDYQNPERLEWENPEQYRLLIQYQKEIYGELARRKIHHIFVEGLQEEQMGKDLENWKRTIRPQIKDPETRDRILAHYGGAFVYALENKNVHLHPTESKEVLLKIDAHSGIYSDNSIPDELNEEREDYPVKQIQAFFKKNPGAKVVLIFGSLHDFRDNVERIFPDRKPLQTIVSFPQVAKKYVELSEK